MSDIGQELVYTVVEKLIGPIEPRGECHVDGKRMMNLILWMAVMNKMVFAATQVARESNSHLGSCRDAGQYAQACLENIRKSLNEDFEERS